MPIKVFKYKFEEKLFDEFGSYFSQKGKEIDELAEDDVDDFLQTRMESVTDEVKEAFLSIMGRQAIAQLFSLEVPFDYNCDGCSTHTHSTHGWEFEIEGQSFIVCDSCREFADKVKEFMDEGYTDEETSKKALEVSDGKFEIIFIKPPE